MANPSRQDIVEAHEALEELRDSAREQAGLRADLQYEDVLAVLPSKPKLTMNEIEWDDDKHFLAEAELDNGNKVIMIGEEPDGTISVFKPSPAEYTGSTIIPNYLIPTGRKFELKEINNG